MQNMAIQIPELRRLGTKAKRTDAEAICIMKIHTKLTITKRSIIDK